PPNPAAPAATTAAAPVAAALSGLLSPSGVSSFAGERRSPGNRRPASSPLLLAGASSAPLSPAPGLRSVPAASVVAGDGSPGAGDSVLPGRRITGCERALLSAPAVAALGARGIWRGRPDGVSPGRITPTASASAVACASRLRARCA